MTLAERTRITYHNELWRAGAAGVLESAGKLFLLLIAVRWYHAGSFSKAMIAAGGSFGLMLGPWLVSRVHAAGVPVGLAASRLALLGAATFTLIAAIPRLPVYVIGSVVALAASSVALPLLTQMYQENYPSAERGRRFARAMMLRIATAAIFCELGGRLLSAHLEYFRWLLLVFAGAFGVSAVCLARCPTGPLRGQPGAHPFHALRFARSDRLFRQTLIAWMFLGFAMLMMAPLRVEYLANPAHGVTLHHRPLTAGAIALITGVVPNLARLLMNPIWGRLFDKVNFFVLRLTLNLGFALGILAFFTTDTLAGLLLGAVFFGISTAGTDVAWSLWVTKFAPPDRVADYMSVHTFFTGLRGVIAPVAAFQLVNRLPLSMLGWISVGLIGVGSAVLIPELRWNKRARSAPVPVEEIPD